MTADGMSAVIAALGGSVFLDQRLSREVVSGRVDQALDRGWAVVEELLAQTNFEPNSLRLMGQSGRVEPDLYLTSVLSGGIMRRALRPAVLLHELASGATLTLNDADRMHLGIQVDREILEYAVCRLAWCNGFVSHTSESAFGRHSDSHDTVIVHTEGTKHWRVYSPSDGAVVYDRVMRPGDVLHVPTGWEHEVTGTGEPSLHWTFGFTIPSDVDLLCDELKGRTDAHGILDLLGTDRRTRDERARVRSLERRAGMNLPWAFGKAPEVTDAIAVRWAARLPPVIEPGPEAVVVRSLGRRFRFDSRLETPLRLLATGARVSVAGLVVDRATAPVVLAFLRWALGERLILLEGDVV